MTPGLEFWLVVCSIAGGALLTEAVRLVVRRTWVRAIDPALTRMSAVRRERKEQTRMLVELAEANIAERLAALEATVAAEVDSHRHILRTLDQLANDGAAP